ncbi:MAG: hypothetical protein LBV08_04535 [Clostridiales bacterium]|jgi:hypothetical protein|nr:hypothetical protein [Clostridiales bacterium]
MDFKSLINGLDDIADNIMGKDVDLAGLVNKASIDTAVKALSSTNLGLDDAKNILSILTNIGDKDDDGADPKKASAKLALKDNDEKDAPSIVNSIMSFLSIAKDSPELVSSILSVLPKILSIVTKDDKNDDKKENKK